MQVEHPPVVQGLSVGLLFFALVSVSVPYAGGSLNPVLDTALPLASWLLDDATPDDALQVLQTVWIYWAGPILGALVASGFFDFCMM
jgi:glycerol uptake facilitator-like aquaporin